MRGASTHLTHNCETSTSRHTAEESIHNFIDAGKEHTKTKDFRLQSATRRNALAQTFDNVPPDRLRIDRDTTILKQTDTFHPIPKSFSSSVTPSGSFVGPLVGILGTFVKDVCNAVPTSPLFGCQPCSFANPNPSSSDRRTNSDTLAQFSHHLSRF